MIHLLEAVCYCRADDSFTGSSVLLQGIELGTVQVPLHQIELISDIVSGLVVVGLQPSLPVQGISLILGNDIAGGKVEANPCVSDVPKYDISNRNEILFPACALTWAVAQTQTRNIHEQEVGGRGMPDISSILDDVSLNASQNAVPPTIQGHSLGNSEQVQLEIVQNPLFSPWKLVEEQQADSELCKLQEYAVSESEAHKVPVCYFIRDDILMRKWRPRDVAASEVWRVVNQVVVTPLYHQKC